MKNIWIVVGALLGAAFVILGAVMQHVVGTDADMLMVLSKAQHYHMLHLIMLILIGWFIASDQGKSGLYLKLLHIAAILFLVAIILFSGNLYLKVMSSRLYMIYLVPVGGTLFIGGWLVLAIAFAIRPE